MRLYRVVWPGNTAAGSDWVTEEVWQQITRVPDPKTAWRKHLAVWPDWNADGQFVVYDLKPGEELKVWRGPAAAQEKPPKAGLDDRDAQLMDAKLGLPAMPGQTSQTRK